MNSFSDVMGTSSRDSSSTHLFRLFNTDLLFGAFNVETVFLEVTAKDNPDTGFA